MRTEPTVVVLTALEVEYAAVRSLLSDLQVQTHSTGTRFEVGPAPHGEGSIVLALCGPGNQAAAVLAERAIAMFTPEALLFVGVAGALHDDLEAGDVVVATKVYSYHGGKDENDGFRTRPQAWDAPHELDQIARHIARDRTWTAHLRPPPDRQPPVRFRPIAAGEVVLNSRTTPLAEQLRTTYDDAAAIEMESAGAAKAGHLNRKSVLTVRGISDKADGLKHAADAAGWQSIASAHAAAFAITLATEVLHNSNTGHREDPLNRVDRVGGKHRRSWLLALAAVLIVGAAAIIHFGPPFASGNEAANTAATSQPKTEGSVTPPPQTSRSESPPSKPGKPPRSRRASVTTTTLPAQPGPDDTANECDDGKSASDPIHTDGYTSSHRWGWAYTVYTAACSHWGSVNLHEVLPAGYRVDVTLTRYHNGKVADHRYCQINAGEKNCSAPGIRTEECLWTYRTTAEVRSLNGPSEVVVAKSVDEELVTSCKK